ncbi:MAG: extracellular solute-binding protein [Reyranella sp.]|nr:extracellular solute-binding protein [Reyranella sp.]MBL6653127.1 extracellular solute-binding protein [Reyranella sp.]
MSRAISRRPLILGAAALAAPAVLPRQSLGNDVKVDLVHLWSGADHPIQKLIKAFNDKGTGVTVVSRQDGTTYETITQKAMASIAAGRGPAMMTTGWKLGDFARKTLGAQDFRQIFGPERAEALLAKFRPQVRPLAAVSGVPIGLPWSMSTPVVYINQSLWAAAGLDPAAAPKTVEELYPMVRQLQEKTGKQGLCYEVNEWLPQAFIQNAGGDVIDADSKPAMDSAAAVKGIEAFVQPRRDNLWRVMTIPEMVAAFQAGAIGVMASSSARQSVVRSAAKFDLRLIQMPGLAGHPRRMNSGGNLLAVYSKVKEQQDGAYKFMEFVSSKEGFEIWLETGYLNVTTNDIPVRPGNEAAQAQMEGGLTSETIWPGARGLEALTVHIDWITKIVNGAVSVPEGLRSDREAVEKLVMA